MIERGIVAEEVLLNPETERFDEETMTDCISYVFKRLQDGALEALIYELVVEYKEREMETAKARDRARMRRDREERSRFEEILNRKDGWRG